MLYEVQPPELNINCAMWALKTNVPDHGQPHHHYLCHSHTAPSTPGSRQLSAHVGPHMPSSTPDVRHSPSASWSITLMLASLPSCLYARRARSTVPPLLPRARACEAFPAPSALCTEAGSLGLPGPLLSLCPCAPLAVGKPLAHSPPM